ncbi:MAG: MFS transporter [Geminicoccaceae bacterium]|nr:MFS transporter [Geminicoccaceae bacterium]
MRGGTSGWLESARVYLEPRILGILFLGFASGLPLALTGGTLTVRLAEAGVEIATIGFFAWVGLAYGWKFLWSPVVDHVPLPILTRLLGRRRGWLVFVQVALAAAVAALGAAAPEAGLARVAALAVLVAFLSATQDIVIDAFRVELVSADRQGAAAAMLVIGYRLAMFVSGAGALLLAEWYGWVSAYAVMAILLLAAIAVTLALPEPVLDTGPLLADSRPSWKSRIEQALVAPFSEFFARNGVGTTLSILSFVVLFKVGDALLSALASPLYVGLGFAKTEIAAIVKSWGLAAVLLGGVLGGLLVRRLGLLPSLWFSGLAQMLSNLTFLLLYWSGRDQLVLSFAITVENLAGGMGTTAFVAYLSSLCNVTYTATQYALLSSLMAQARTFLAGFAGVFQTWLGWPGFIVFTAIAALPGLVLIRLLERRLRAERAETPAVAHF